MTSASNGWELRVCPLDLSHLKLPYSMNWIDDNYLYLNLFASNHIYLPSSQCLTHDSFRDPSQSQKLLRSHPGGNETPVIGQADSPHQVDGNGRWHRSQGWDHEENLDIGFGWHPTPFYPIGSMYGIYANIGDILMVNVTIYGIHGSYGYGNLKVGGFTESSEFLEIGFQAVLPAASGLQNVILQLTAGDVDGLLQKAGSGFLHGDTQLGHLLSMQKDVRRAFPEVKTRCSPRTRMQSRRTLLWNKLFEQSTFFPCYRTSAL